MPCFISRQHLQGSSIIGNAFDCIPCENLLALSDASFDNYDPLGPLLGSQLTFGVSVLLDVPDGVQLVVVLVADNLVLVEAPLRVDLAGELERVSGADVDQLDLGSDGLPGEDKNCEQFCNFTIMPFCNYARDINVTNCSKLLSQMLRKRLDFL